MDLPVCPPVSPMLAKPIAAIPDGDFDYEPKWDGFRCIVFRDGDDVVLASRTTKPMDRYFPEVVAAVRDVLPPRAVVDGEIVLAHDGRLDFDALSQRIHPAASRVELLSEQTPATLVVFDVLALDEDLTGRPLGERLAALDALGLVGPRVFATQRTRDADEARAWFTMFEGAGLDGVVAKNLSGAYRPGQRGWAKIKHARTADVVLAGFRLHKDSTDARPLVGSLLLGLYDAAGALQFVGAASSFPVARRAELVGELAPLEVAVSASHPWVAGGGRVPGAPSRWSSGKDMAFVPLAPERVVEVAYDHMEGDRFRHTVQFRRWRPDRDPASCTYAQLEEPVGYDLATILPGAAGAARRG